MAVSFVRSGGISSKERLETERPQRRTQYINSNSNQNKAADKLTAASPDSADSLANHHAQQCHAVGDNADDERRADDERVDHRKRNADRKRIETRGYRKEDQLPAARRIEFTASTLFAAKCVAHDISANQSQQREGYPGVESI